MRVWWGPCVRGRHRAPEGAVEGSVVLEELEDLALFRFTQASPFLVGSHQKRSAINAPSPARRFVESPGRA